MTLERKLNLFNNIIGILTLLYTFLVFVISFIFKENSQKILIIAFPVFLLLAIMVVLTFIIIDYFRKRFTEFEQLQERVKKLEEIQTLDVRLRNIEEKLIRQEYQQDVMQKRSFFPLLHKKGNSSFLYILLAILLLALLLWYIFILQS